MKIKTLSPNNFCVATASGVGFKIQCREDVDIGQFTREHTAFLGHCDEKHCISKEVEMNQPFFCSLVVFEKQRVTATTNYVAFLEKHGDETHLIPTKRLGGGRVLFGGGETVLIYGFYPKDFSFLGDHQSCVMTSDGLIYLGPDEFIGHKDGVLDTMSPSEVLEKLSKYRTPRSPNYGAVTVSPTKTRPSRPRKGTIIHNEVSGKLEIFTNGNWKSLKFED